jgi:hypothetical protein
MTAKTTGIVTSIMAVGIGLAACGAADADQLYAGTAKADITPEEAIGSPNGGCAFRLPDDPDRVKSPPTNIHDRIFARVVVLKNGKTSLAIVSLDLALFASKKVITEAREKWDVDHVILSSTHTHSFMVPRGLCPTPKGWEAWENVQQEAGELLDWPGFSEDPWYAATEAKIVAAIGEAMQHLFPAQLVAGKGPYESVYMAHNRRVVGADGKATSRWLNPKRLPTKPIDPTVGVIQVNDDSGKPRALGDLDPYEGGWNLMQQAGISLGKAALRVARSLKAQPENRQSSIEIKEDLMQIPYRNGDKVTEACVMTAVINQELALVTMPGEIFIQHQLDINGKSPVASTFLLGQAYCGAGSPWLRYIPTVQAVKEGGFGASTDWYSFIAADAGARMVAQAVASIHELMRTRDNRTGSGNP